MSASPDDASVSPERSHDASEATRSVLTARWTVLAGVVALLLVALVVGLMGGGGTDDGGPTRVFGDAKADALPYDGRSPVALAADTERVLIELPRPALGASQRRAQQTDRRQRAYVASLRMESESLVSALRARGAKLRDVVTYERTWHGFAATVRARDLPALQSLGVRARANRRFFPAFSQPVPAAGAPAPVRPATAPSVTLLAGGVGEAPPGGYDAVDRDARPLPGTDLRDPQRPEVGGEPLAAALRVLGARVRVVRVSALVDGEEAARTDTLLAGLERTVDPDRDGATSDHDATALIGVQAPYAGFADAPEAAAVRAAERLGTTVLAAGGENGRGAGTVASPGASRGAVAVGALATSGALARSALRVGNTTVTGAAVLAGTPPTGEMTTARPPGVTTSAALLVANEEPLTDKLAIVEAGSNPGARAAAVAGAGAGAVLLAEPRPGHVLPTLPAGRVGVPVLGVTGKAAAAILDLEPGTTAEATGLRGPKGPYTTGNRSRFAAAGPAYDGTRKPDLVRPGSIVAGGRLITGSAVAAARLAVDAARGRDVAPAPDTAQRRPPAAGAVPVTSLTASAPGAVTLTVGRFARGDPLGGEPTAVVPAARLELTLTREGSEDVVERLTPPGGERGVLPGAYAYTLPARLRRGLEPGAYVFRVQARAPRQRKPTRAVSRPITIK